MERVASRSLSTSSSTTSCCPCCSTASSARTTRCLRSGFVCPEAGSLSTFDGDLVRVDCGASSREHLPRGVPSSVAPLLGSWTWTLGLLSTGAEGGSARVVGRVRAAHFFQLQQQAAQGAAAAFPASSSGLNAPLPPPAEDPRGGAAVPPAADGASRSASGADCHPFLASYAKKGVFRDVDEATGRRGDKDKRGAGYIQERNEEIRWHRP